MYLNPQDELRKVNQLLTVSEKNLYEEIERQKQMAATISKLTQVKTLLQHQLEGASSNSVNEKQVNFSPCLIVCLVQ
jgi:hypothetical protein